MNMQSRLEPLARAVRVTPTNQYICQRCRYASVASAYTPAAPVEQMTHAPTPMTTYPPTQPPSHKRPEFRKTQLHRQYQSALRSSPLMVIFQHNNLKAIEWSGIRRELLTALKQVDNDLAKEGAGPNEAIGEQIKLQIVHTGVFASALKVVEFWNPNFESQPQSGSAKTIEPKFKHGLSKSAWVRTQKSKDRKHGLEPLMSGPIATLVFPTVSPRHLKAALSILTPSKAFPAPKRKAMPTYYEPAIQVGLQKLMLLGARIEGKAFDMDGVKWVGGIPGGLDGLRAQLVGMLSGVGAGITNTLETASRSLYVTMESRKSQLEDETKEKENGGS